MINKALEVLMDCYKNGGKVLICGNGGSSADSAHIMAELMKGFKKKRTPDEKFFDELKKVLEPFQKEVGCTCGPKKLEKFKEVLEQGLPAIDLTAFNALNTAFANDKDSDFVFANSVLGLGKTGDVLIVISTSGNAKTCTHAALVAKAKGMKVIVFTGNDGGKLKALGDVNIMSSEKETYKIQEDHIKFYHELCLKLEEEFFKC